MSESVNLPQIGNVACGECGAPGGVHRGDCVEAATIADLCEALSPMIRGASEADYYCPDDVAEDHTVLISVTVAELRAARAALLRAQASEQSGG